MKIVSYLRVSTARQGVSGLGLEAQRSAVQNYVQSAGHEIIAEYIEIESGKRDDRPELIAALATCDLHRATICIAKLDRLARNVAFIANLMNGGVEFVACDMPHANRLTLHLMAAMAEHEREMISQRTKAALQAAKCRGAKLGNPNGAIALLAGCKQAAKKAAEIRSAKALQRYRSVAPIILEAKSNGHATNRQIARYLNQKGLPAASGGQWYPEQVRRVILALPEFHGIDADKLSSQLLT